MHRFYLPAEQCQASTLVLTGREAHHGAGVLRLRQAERVTVLNGVGGELICEVEQLERRQVRLRVLERRTIPPLPFQVTLLQALPKGKAFESIIQKATELGAFRLVPLRSERVVAAPIGEKETADKIEKWRLLAVEAIKQCGSAWLPRIEPPLTPKQFLARNEVFELSLLASLHGGARHPREYFSAYRSAHSCIPRSVCVWVGPEGDFTADEVEMITAAGARPMTLGRLVLRTDTAATSCLSIINYELQAPL
jgi:16S rRNA (uracil1498-N3)-methyltransferase